ncbi:MAG: hotdog fold domain-containing protein [Nevskia sp.]|jgi:acyl-coenzyme A thioesterase PaaI-like protein|nr:hotdog fold domain-containing protein [Nevskia sp.]
MNKPSPLKLFDRLSRLPLGRQLFTRGVCATAPYFGSIRPLVTELRVGRCVAELKQRRAVQNHIGTVHAIAMCNLCELVAGLLIEATLPETLRWIPKGMTVRYLRKAKGDLRAVLDWQPQLPADFLGDVVLSVAVLDTQDQRVMEADITMYVSPRR